MATARDNLARKQIFIPATVPEEEIVLRVAAYCRVSTDSDDQINSFTAQNSHYMELITAHERWELVDIYADEGITGTSAKKRKDFQRLLTDCRNGQIDKVLVKSISRFARNTTECLEAVRELKSLGISIFFEEHNIDTKMVSSEMLTAVIASCAQAESESISKNMRWSYQKRMENGTYIPSSVPYGYRLIDKEIVIEPYEAIVVCQIYSMYLSGQSKLNIATALNDREIPTRKGRQWDYCAIRYILRNERYAGNSLWQKTYKTEDFPPKKLRNYGERAKYYVEGTHPPIIDAETFMEVQHLLRKRSSFFCAEDIPDDPVRERLVCGNCGGNFRRKTSEGIQYWCCRKHASDAASCPTMAIPAEKLKDAFLRLWFNLTHYGNVIFENLLKNLYAIRDRQMLRSPAVVELNREISDILSQSHALNLLNKQGLVDPDIFISKSNQLAEQLRKAKQRKENLLKKKENDVIEQTKSLQGLLRDGPEYLEDFDEELFCELVDKIIVESNTRIRFLLKNGLELPESLERRVR